MSILIYVSLLGWIPVCLLLFALLPPQRAVVAGVVGGWLLLPPATIPLPGLPDYDKVMAPIVGIALATLIFQPNRLLAFRPKWFDWPALIWCICPMMASLSNGLGVYDGLSGMLRNLTAWGGPYLIGRLFFGTFEGLRELATGIAIGGLLWVVPCLVEMRLSPILLSLVYGLSRFEGTRLGGWRPRVFFSTGLELGMWMTASSLVAVWLWKSGALKRIGPYSMGVFFLPVLLLTTVFCRATGALTLLVIGLAVLWLSAQFRSKLFLCMLLLTPPTYYVVRIPNLWTGATLVEYIGTYFNQERAASLGYRFDKENMLAEKALNQPLWGWGTWGRNRIKDRTGRDIAETDGMWIIFLGEYGFVGLLSWSTTMLLPAWLFVYRFPVREWSRPTVGPVAALATLLGLYMIDCLANGFLNLSYLVAAGGLMCVQPSSSVAIANRDAARRRQQFQEKQARDGDPGGEQFLPAMLGATSDAGPAHRLLPVPQMGLADRYWNLAKSLKMEGRLVDSESAMTHAHKILVNLSSGHPDDAELQRHRWDCANDLAWLLVGDMDSAIADPIRGVRLAMEATEGDPECAAYWNTLGTAYCLAGDPTSAISALERSLALLNGQGTVFDYTYLAWAHAQLGNTESAYRWTAQAKLCPDAHSVLPDLFARLNDRIASTLASYHGRQIDKPRKP